MILRTELVEQRVDDDRTVRVVKDVLMTSGLPLGMIRKRLAGDVKTKGAVVLVHGFAQNRYTWHSSARSFSAYLAAEGWDVFVAETLPPLLEAFPEDHFSLDMRGIWRSLKSRWSRFRRGPRSDFLADAPTRGRRILTRSR